MFNEPWILPDVVYVIDFTFFHEGEYYDANFIRQDPRLVKYN